MEGASKPEGPVTNPLALRHERLHGVISKYVPSSGWGFVSSELFEGEVGFKMENVMLECQNHDFREGQVVEFDVQADERGRAQAVALKPMVGRKPSECIGQRQRGHVRRFADRWGFLNSASFDGDLFVHRDNLLLAPEQMQEGIPPLRSGQAVEFDVAIDDRGRTVAKQITTSALMRPCEWIGRRLYGYIRSFQGAWGFINSERFAGDLFVHRDSLLPQFQGMDLAVGMMVEFDVERDHHKKGGRNRLVARQVAVLPGGAPNGAQAPMAGVPAAYDQSGYPVQGPDAMRYPPQQAPHAPDPYNTPMYPQGGMYYPGTPGQPAAGGSLGYQPPYPYADPNQYAQPPAGPYGPPQPGVPQQSPIPPVYGGMPAPPQPVPYNGQSLPQQYPGQPQGYSAPTAYAPPNSYAQQMPPAAAQAGIPDPAIAAVGMGTIPQAINTNATSNNDGQGEQPNVMLHITTHDWEPDQSGQLRVTKGTLVNVSHRAAHGWVYAATVQPGGMSMEPLAEGWIPQAVAKRVSLCRVVLDWPAEGSGTLALSVGDLIAVSKEAERGWVYGERISPRRTDMLMDGWVPKKVLEYILM
mmetsp:Transcript_74511/g.155332  ORF Transcript_74511/g.155332 Transcript_74511/m.155332 type:complete len:581 (-) Transcript_74511:115-1857(-)